MSLRDMCCLFSIGDILHALYSTEKPGCAGYTEAQLLANTKLS